MNKEYRWLYAGYLLQSATTSLWQDALGKQAYIKAVNDCWIDAHVTVPFAVCTIIFAMFIIVSGKE